MADPEGRQINSSGWFGMSLSTAAQSVGLATLGLPLVGLIVRLIQDGGRAIPLPAILSESVPGLAWAGVVALVPLPFGLVLVPLSRRSAEAYRQRAERAERLLASLEQVKEHGTEVDAALAAVEEASARANESQTAPEAVEAAVKHLQEVTLSLEQELSALENKTLAVMPPDQRLLARVRLIGGQRMATAVALPLLYGSLALAALTVGAISLLDPFPEGIGIALGSILLAWPWRRSLGSRAITTRELAPYLVATLLISTIAIGLTPTHGRAVYVVTSAASAAPGGWYVQLGDSTNPMYMLTCSGSKTIALPASSIESVTYSSRFDTGDSLLHILQTGHFEGFGLVPLCPSGSPGP